MLFPQGIAVVSALHDFLSTSVPEKTSSSDGTVSILAFFGIGLLFLVVIIDSRKRPPEPKKSPEETEHETAEKYGEQFLESKFVEVLAEHAKQRIAHDATLTRIQIQSKQIVFDHEELPEQTVLPYQRLGYNDLAEENLSAVACALKLKIGEQCHLCCDKEGKPTSRLKISPLPLKDPNPKKPES